jgi:hypothetical protein
MKKVFPQTNYVNIINNNLMPTLRNRRIIGRNHETLGKGSTIGEDSVLTP